MQYRAAGKPLFLVIFHRQVIIYSSPIAFCSFALADQNDASASL